ncbi:MAG: ornithine carbamoyltransferase [Bdellovibrionales bacterium]
MKFRAKHFLTGVELDHQELEDVLEFADQLKMERDSGKTRTDLQHKQVALLFEKPSLRTRVSFTVAVQELAGNVIELVSSNRKKEEPEDTIRVLEGYVHATMVRTFEHGVLDKMAQFSKGALINGLSDSHHPCQALADLLTLKQEFKKIKGLKLAYVGDGNNVLHSLLLLAPFLGVEVSYACPKGYEPNSFIVKQAKVRAKEGGGKVSGFVDPVAAVKGAHAIYTDVWTSMGQEDEGGDRDQIFADYQINEDLYKHALSDAILLHCMPMVRGKEITDQMVEHPKSRLFQQSENRLHAQKALLVGLMGNA